MSRDLGISIEDKREIARLIDEGCGGRSLSKKYCVHRTSAKKWIHTYKATGLDGLLAMGSAHRRYGYETKLAAARAVVEEGATRADAMARYGIVSESSLKRWSAVYRENGPDALKPRPKGRPSGAKSGPKAPESELERLRAENERLRCELEVQKRLDALARARSRAARRPR